MYTTFDVTCGQYCLTECNKRIRNIGYNVYFGHRRVCAPCAECYSIGWMIAIWHSSDIAISNTYKDIRGKRDVRHQDKIPKVVFYHLPFCSKMDEFAYETDERPEVLKPFTLSRPEYSTRSLLEFQETYCQNYV